jgi:hypothetical protein
MGKVKTRGNVIVNDIKIGDILYEFEYGECIKSEVTSLPIRNDDGQWQWFGKCLDNDEVIEYGVHEKYLNYAPKLYDYEAY